MRFGRLIAQPFIARQVASQEKRRFNVLGTDGLRQFDEKDIKTPLKILARRNRSRERLGDEPPAAETRLKRSDFSDTL